MANKPVRCVGFDCGNSSIRTVLGICNSDTINIEVIHQVPNNTVRVNGYDYWDILYIFNQMQQGLKKAVETAGGKVDSAGISTWGIDFGMFGSSLQLLGNPLCYRNELGNLGMQTLDKKKQRRMFDLSGIQNHPMNTVYQLAGIRDQLPEYYAALNKVMLTPDLLNMLFTGEWNGETSIASTTQLMNMKTGTWDDELFKTAGIKKDIMPPLVSHGNVRGILLKEIAEQLDIPQIPFIAVPSHDTAAAVVSVPAGKEPFAFISSGTWSLIGTELQSPIINNTVYECKLANEGGACNTITLLKNSAGMHILQNIKHELEIRENREWSWDRIVDMSMHGSHIAGDTGIPLFDPNHADLYHPESMICTLEKLTGTRNLSVILAGVYSSLACNYRKTIADIEKIADRVFPVIHIIGGGSRNTLLNQLTADVTGKTVIAGPAEATSLGTVAVQLLYHYPDFDLQKIRDSIAGSVRPEKYLPSGKHDHLFRRFACID